MKRYKINSNEITSELINRLRTNTDYSNAKNSARVIVDEVKKNGNAAVEFFARQYDGVPENFSLSKISLNKIEQSKTNVDEKLKYSIETVYKNIEKFHAMQCPVEYEIETASGVICGRKATAIESVGLYIPGGTAPLISTLLMLSIPAKLAGCSRVVVITPGERGEISDEILFASAFCGIDEIYPVGGAHGIALLAYGTENITPVNKIFGPGNQYVTAAKMLVSTDPDGCAIDMPAGPSEVLIIADEHANPSFVAADFLSQLEHGNDSQAILVTDSSGFISKFEVMLYKLYSGETRKAFIEKSLANSCVIEVKSIADAVKISNLYAPEHLILNTSNNEKIFDQITGAGSVFIGEFSPESAGDYASGTNHSLPTSGYAKSYGGVSVEDFRKYISYQKLTKQGLKSISDSIYNISEYEGLEAHANAVRIRLNES